MTRTASLALASILLAGCVVGLPPRPAVIPAPIVAPGSLTIPPARAGLPPLLFEGAWELRDGRYCVAGGAVRLATAAGVIPFDDAHLCVTTSPVSIDGEATVALPGLGFMARAGVRAEGRRARIRLALGGELGAIDLDGRRLRANPDHYYVYVHYADGFSATIGQASFQSPGGAATVVIDPQEPLVYVAGRLSMPGFEADAAFGFSPDGRLAIQPARQLADERGPIRPRIAGHLLIAGTVPIPGLPISVSGETVVDLDADDDGVTLFEGDQHDLAFLVNGGLSVGYGKQGFNLSLQVAQGSLLYDGRTGAVYVAGEVGGLFAGTPLAALAPQQHGTLSGYFRGPDAFALRVDTEARVLGFATSRARFTLDPTGLFASMRLELPAGMGGADVSGSVDARGRFDLRGKADLTIAGLRLLGADLSLSPSGVAVSGVIDLPGLGRVAVAGQVRADGNVDLRGAGDLRPFGLRLAGARVAVSRSGASIEARVAFLGATFVVSGQAAAGHFSLGGRVTVDLLLLKGRTELTISDGGVRALVYGRACVGPSCIDLAGLEIDGAGRICPIFPVVGRQCIKVI